MKPNNDINSLSPDFRKKFDPRWAEVTKKYPNAKVFEAHRSQERQDMLYAQGRTKPGKIVTRTRHSKHIQGLAVDVVFLDAKGKPTRSGPYDDLIEMAKKYGIENLKPKETCHFEDNGEDFILSPSKKMTEEQKQLTLKAGLMALQAAKPEIKTDAIKKAIDVLMAECEKVGIIV